MPLSRLVWREPASRRDIKTVEAKREVTKKARSDTVVYYTRSEIMQSKSLNFSTRARLN